MKTTHGLSIAALVAAMIVTSVPANDQTKLLNGVVDSVQGTVNNTVDSIDNTVNGGAASGTLGDVINTVTGGDITGGDVNGGDAGNLSEVGNVSDVSDLSNVPFLNVSDVFNDFDANAFNDALSNNATDIAALQDNLNGNEAFKDLLNGNNIGISDIVGIDNNQDGSLIVYTDSDS